MKLLFVTIYRFFQKRPGLFRITLVVAFALVAAGAAHIRFEQDINKMIPRHGEMNALDQVLNHTDESGRILFAIAHNDSTLFLPDSLIWYADTFQAAVRERVGTALIFDTLSGNQEYEHELLALVSDHLPLWLDSADYVRLDSLLQPDRLQAHLAEEKKRLLSPAGMVTGQWLSSDPVGLLPLVLSRFHALQPDGAYSSYGDQLFNENARAIYFFARPADSRFTAASNQRLIQTLSEFTSDWERRYPQLSLSWFGAPVVAAENALQMKKDTLLTLSLTLVLLLAFTYYIFRRKRIPLLLFLPVLFGGLFGLTMAGLIQERLSIIALGAGALILGIALDFSIHFLNHARAASNREDLVRQLAQPLTLGAFTTIAAFLSLRFAEAPVLQDLGTFAAFSLMGASFFTLVFLPQLIRTGPSGLTRRSGKKPGPNLIDRMARWQPEKNRWLLLAVLLLTPVWWYFAGKVQFDGDLMNLNYMSPRTAAAQEHFQAQNDFALSAGFVVAEGENEAGAAEKLSRVGPLLQQMKAAGKIRDYQLPTDILPPESLQRSRVLQWEHYWDSNRVRTAYENIQKAGVELGFSSDAFSAFLETLRKPYAPLDSAAAAFLKGFMPGRYGSSAQGSFLSATIKPAPEHRAEVLEALTVAGEVQATDRQAFSERLLQSVRHDFNTLLFISGALVFFTLLLAYGRIELALMAFLPMAITWVWILGIMAVLGLEFNFINVIISTLLFGLGDDYSIFMMDSLLKRYRTGKREIRKNRAGIYLSVITTIIGLGTLVFASHPALKSMAWVTILGLLCVTLISQILQPFLFNFMIQRRADKGFMPFTLWSLIKSTFSFIYFFAGCLIVTLCGFALMGLRPFGRRRSKFIFHWILSKYTGSVMYVMANVRKRVIRYEAGIFEQPAVYIANHASFLDILLTTMLHPRLILITNKWVWRSPVFGKIVRMAEYYPAMDGAEESLEPLRKLVAEGYGIVVFPEGTRSLTDKAGRFHKGAFFIAERLGLNIHPVVLHGVHYTMQKGDWLLKDGTTSVHLYPAIRHADRSWGATYQERAKSISRFFKAQFTAIKTAAEQPVYFKEQLIRSFTYKGPVTEWYCRIKTRMENYYLPFHQALPKSGLIYDLGCGYGFMSFLLHWSAPERRFIGMDYDEEKIATAAHNYTLNKPFEPDRLTFRQADLNTLRLEPCAGIVLSDVLHYLVPEAQDALLRQAAQALLPGGVLIVRDGVTELAERHQTTRRTEWFSTRLLKFNKTRNDLHFLSRRQLEDFASGQQLDLKVVDHGGRTSNLIFIFTKPSL